MLWFPQGSCISPGELWEFPQGGQQFSEKPLGASGSIATLLHLSWSLQERWYLCDRCCERFYPHYPVPWTNPVQHWFSFRSLVLDCYWQGSGTVEALRYYKTFQEHFRNFILPSASMLLPPKERARLVPVIIPQPLREEEGFVQFLLWFNCHPQAKGWQYLEIITLVQSCLRYLEYNLGVLSIFL